MGGRAQTISVVNNKDGGGGKTKMDQDLSVTLADKGKKSA